MTVNAKPSFVEFLENGVTVGPIPVEFKFIAERDLVLWRLVDGRVGPPLVLGTDYTVAGAGNPSGGSVTLTVPGPVGSLLRIQRFTSRTQPLDYTPGDTFPAESHEAGLDRLTLIAQEIGDGASAIEARALLVPDGEPRPRVLPAKDLRRGKFHVWDAGGDAALSNGTGADLGLREDLAASTGPALLGYAVEAAYADGTLGNMMIPRVLTRAALAEVGPVEHKLAYLVEGGRTGAFICRLGAAPADPLQGIYVASSTAGFHWARLWGGNRPDARWWGAVLNDGAVDSAPAIQACIDVTGKMYFPVGLYYGSAGLNGNAGPVMRGAGHLVSGYVCSHPTDHLLSNAGTTDTFATGGDFRDFTLARSVTPATPANLDDDRTQGHGLHLDLVSNPRVNKVYTYNNLVEVYVARTLGAQIENVRGLRQTGGGADRWTGLMVYGDPTGMPGGWATGPSGNASCTIKKIQMAAIGGLSSSIAFSLQKHLQDLWIEDPEAGGGHIQFDINPDSTTAGDVFIIRPVADGYVTHGFKIRNMPLDASMIIRDAWVAPSAAATSSGVLLAGAHGLDMNVKGNFTLASGLRGMDASDCSQMKLNGDMVNCQFPMVLATVNSSELKIRGFKNYASANFGDVVTVINSNTSTIDVCTVAVGAQKYNSVCNIDNLSSGLNINVTRTYAGSAVDKIRIAGAPVTSQGNVGGHVIINPGAGAML